MLVRITLQPLLMCEMGKIILLGITLCRIRLPASDSVPFFQRQPRSYCGKTEPDPIWMSWSGFGQTHLVRKPAGVQDTMDPVSGRTQPARYPTSFPLSDSVAFFHRRPGSYYAKTARIRFGPGCQVLAKRIRSESKPACKNHPARFWPTLPS